MLWKSAQTKTKNSYCNAPAEQGDSKMQQKLSSHTVVAAKYGTHCVALPKLEAKSQKYKLAAFFQGHNSSVETFQIRLSLGGSDRSSECSYTVPAHPPKPQPLWQRHICGAGQSLISDESGLCDHNFSRMASCRDWGCFLPVPTTGILTAVHTSSIYEGQEEHFTDHPNTGCPLILNSTIFLTWFWIHNNHIH